MTHQNFVVYSYRGGEHVKEARKYIIIHMVIEKN
jgi:hypothetical protein